MSRPWTISSSVKIAAIVTRGYIQAPRIFSRSRPLSPRFTTCLISSPQKSGINIPLSNHPRCHTIWPSRTVWNILSQAGNLYAKKLTACYRLRCTNDNDAPHYAAMMHRCCTMLGCSDAPSLVIMMDNFTARIEYCASNPETFTKSWTWTKLCDQWCTKRQKAQETQNRL